MDERPVGSGMLLRRVLIVLLILFVVNLVVVAIWKICLDWVRQAMPPR
jgi:hypothetical protein